MVSKYVKSLKREFKGYNGQRFLKDLMAGVTVAAVALPLALAFGVSSGADAAAGLITAIISGFVMSLLSGASYQISGPTGAMTAILITIVSRFQLQGVFIACLMAGVILLLAGIFKIGKLVGFIPMPVITGFTSGIAIIIALGQIDNFFGTTSAGETAIEKLISYGELGFSPNISAVVTGLIVIVIMILWPMKWNAKVPASLLAIIVAGIISVIFNFDIARVGEIPQTLLPETRLDLFNIDFSKITQLIAPAFTIAALGMIESLLCASSASRMKNEPFNADVELVSQGVGNIIIPFFGGVPSTAAIARTSVAIKSGGQTRLTGVIHALFLLICMFLLGPIMAQLPLSALAGVLIMTAWRMNEWHSIKYMFKKKFTGAILKFLITMMATVVFDLTIAIIIGCVFAVLVFVKNAANLDIVFSKVENNKMKHSEIDVESDNKKTIVAYITGPIFFGNAEKFVAKMKSEQCKGVNKIILSMRGVSLIDITGVGAIKDFYNEQKEKNCEICFCGVQNKVYQTLEQAEFVEEIGEDKFFWSVDKALLS